MWIFNNLYSRWDSITRRYKMNQKHSNTVTVTDVLQQQLCGYSANYEVIKRTVTRLGVSEVEDLSTWDDVKVHSRAYATIIFFLIFLHIVE